MKREEHGFASATLSLKATWFLLDFLTKRLTLCARREGYLRNMIRLNQWKLSWVLCGLFLLTACSTPSSRIRKNQEVFDTFDPEIQEQVRAGKIDLGFNEHMVEIALGQPDRTYNRRTERGVSMIWSYTDQRYQTTQRELVRGRFRVRDASGQLRTVTDSTWIDVPVYQEYERLRVEFESGIVTAIEEERLSR